MDSTPNTDAETDAAAAVPPESQINPSVTPTDTAVDSATPAAEITPSAPTSLAGNSWAAGLGTFGAVDKPAATGSRASDSVASSPSGTTVAPNANSAQAWQPWGQPEAPAAPPVTASPLQPTVSGFQPTVTPASFSGEMPQPVIGGADQPAHAVAMSGYNPGKRKGGKKALLLTALLVVLLLGGGGAVYAGYYVPNRPENVWKSALTNSGKAYDVLSNYATTSGTSAKGMSADGSFKLAGAVVADGSFNSKSYGDNGQSHATVSAAGMKLDIDALTIKSSGDTPDFYLKVNGIQGLGGLLGGGDPQITKALDGVNNQWYVIDHTLVEQIDQNAANTQVSRSDVANFLRTIGNSSKQYVFTNDPAKAVVVAKQQIGREKQDGRNVYHYKVGVNKANLQAYVQSLCSGLQSDKIGKLMLNAGSGNNCQTLRDSLKSTSINGTADAWVDMRTKLFHKIRFSDSKQTDNYVDIGQDYQGGSTYPFSLAFHSKDDSTTSDGSFGFSLDSKTNVLTADGKFASKGSSSGDNENGSYSLKVQPYNDASLKVTAPANARSIIQLADDLGVGDLLSSYGVGLGGAAGSTGSDGTITGGIQAKARDTERQTDLSALQSQLEAYFAENGRYSSNADLGSNGAANLKFIATNMKGMDKEALSDPQASPVDYSLNTSTAAPPPISTAIAPSTPKARLVMIAAVTTAPAIH